MWTALTWALIPILAIKFSVIGASIGYSLVGASSVVAIFIAKRYVNFSLTNSMIKPAIGSLVMGIILFITRHFLPVSLFSMEILIAVGSIIYIASMVSMVGLSLVEDVKRSIKTIFAKK
jgi:O-antigen/teichoic acid export membrane protein